MYHILWTMQKLKSCSLAALLMQHLTDKHQDWADVSLDARFRAGCCFPLFHRLYSMPCPGATLQFEICMHSTLRITQLSLRGQGSVVSRAWSCTAWGPDKTRCVRLWINMQSPHCASPIAQPTLRTQAHPIENNRSILINQDRKKAVVFDLLNIWSSGSTLNETSAHESGLTSEFCHPMSQDIAPTETEDNPVDYWHCREILVRFHNTIIHNNSLITNFPWHVLRHRIHLTFTGEVLLLLSVKTCENTLTFTHRSVQKRVNLPNSLIPAPLLLFPLFVLPSKTRESSRLGCVTVLMLKPQACVVHICRRREMQTEGSEESARREKRQTGRGREGHFMTG